MALNDPVPSSALDVLQRNAQDIDSLINGTDPTVTTRTGKVLAAYDQIVSGATEQAENAAQSATEAQAAAESINVPVGKKIAVVGDDQDENIRSNAENDLAFVAGQAGTADGEFRTNVQNDARFVQQSERSLTQVWSGSSTEVSVADILANTGHVVTPGKYWILDGSTAYSIDVLSVTGNVSSQGASRVVSESTSNRVSTARFENLGGFTLLSFLGDSQTGTFITLDEIWFFPF